MAFSGLQGGGFGLDISADLTQVRRMLAETERKLIPVAASQALNRTIRSVQGEVVKALAKDTGIQQKLIREKLRLRTASRKDLRAILDANEAKAVNLIRYVDQVNRRPGVFNRKLASGKYKYAGVRARAWGKLKTYKGTFIGTSGSGNLRVYARVGAERSKLKLISGPSPRRTFVQEVIQAKMRSHARTRWNIEFQRALNNELRKLRARR